MSDDEPRDEGARGDTSRGTGRQPRPDGGSAAGADDVALDPWGSSTVADYRKLFEQFGIEEFDEVLPEVPDPHYLMRRGVIFGHRDYRAVADRLREGGDAAVLSGFMPTGDPHIGHKLVFDEIIWHQQQGADAYGLVADLEAHAARGLSWAEIDEHARSYMLSLLALGFDPEEGELYRQSTNRDVQDLAFELGIKANFSEMQAIYDFDGETDVSHMQSVVTQAADILYPQLDEPKPTVIPVGPDQDPHVRLTRDLAARMRFFGVTEAYASFEAEPAERGLIGEAYDALSARSRSRDGEAVPRDDENRRFSDHADERASGEEGSDDPRADDDGDDGAGDVRCRDAAEWLREHRPGAVGFEGAVESLDAAGKEPLRPRVRVLDRNATEEAFEALIEAIEGEKRAYEGHVDAFEMNRAAAEELAREVEVDNGGYGFYLPSSIYHRFMTGLTGGKMSSSVPASHISLLDDPDEGYDKMMNATTAGGETEELHRKYGGDADECPVYEVYAYLVAGDDDEFAKRVYDECTSGERLCGDCKAQAAALMEEFLREHQEKREEAEELLENLDVELESARRRG